MKRDDSFFVFFLVVVVVVGMGRLGMLYGAARTSVNSPSPLSAMPVKPGMHKIVWCYGVDQSGRAQTKTFEADGVAFAVGRVLFVDKESGMECQIGMENVLVFSPIPQAGEQPFEQ